MSEDENKIEVEKDESGKPKSVKIELHKDSTEPLKLHMSKSASEGSETQTDSSLAEKKIQVYKEFEDPRALECETLEELKDLVGENIREAKEFKRLRSVKPESSEDNTAQYYSPDQIERMTSHLDTEEGYDSYEAMIKDLRAKARNSKNPAEQAEASAILTELFKKLAKAQSLKKHAEPISYEPQKDAKTRGD